jgi:formyl-CoA transferase
VDSVFASLENIPQKFFVDGEIPTRIGNRYEFIYPYDSFRALNGWVIIGIANDAIWERFIEATGLTELLDDRFSTNPRRVDNYEALRAIIKEWTSTMEVAGIVSLLSECGVPASPVYNLKESAEDPQMVAREMTVDVDQLGLGAVRLLGNPVKMSETCPSPRGPAPVLGGDNNLVFQELLGISKEEVERIKLNGAI